MMILSKKIRLKPNKTQEKLLWQSVGTARFIYNWTLDKQQENYKNGGKFISDNDLRKEITVLKKDKLSWLGEVSNNIAKQAVKDACIAYKNFFKKQSVFPKFKSKKKLKRLQKQVSRKYEKSREVNNRYNKSQNIARLEQQIRLVHRRISNIRNNNLHQITNEIVKTKPSKIVMEDLNVKGMMKNKHLSKAIAEQNFYKFIMYMKYKCEFSGIEFIQVSRFYPSSKTCSQCGTIKKDLKLSDRVFKCKCGHTMDRDLNASINLSNYRVS